MVATGVVAGQLGVPGAGMEYEPFPHTNSVVSVSQSSLTVY